MLARSETHTYTPQTVVDRFEALESRIRDLEAAQGLSSDPHIRQAQLSFTTWITSKIGWWSAALGGTHLSKEVFGPVLTSVWSNLDNPVLARITESLQQANPEIAPIIQAGAPFVIGFAVASDFGNALGKIVGTGITLNAPAKSLLRTPTTSIIPNWVPSLNFEQFSRRAFALLPNRR
jgi:hypothetical protein